MLSDLRLYQLISPSLPVGGFTYSQGLELAVESGWVKNQIDFQQWLSGQLEQSLATLELPIMMKMLDALEENDEINFLYQAQTLIAWRETKELRLEETQRGAALTRLLPELGLNLSETVRSACQLSQLAGMTFAAFQWGIDRNKLAAGYLWSWLENAVMAGVKLVPLGQTQGQQTLLNMAKELEAAVDIAKNISSPGSVTPALAIASSRHEIQYTRLFRS